MNLLQQQVAHPQFGDGIVIGQTEQMLTVQFGEIQKAFLFPSAFEQFLSLTDPEQAQQMRRFLQVQKELEQGKLREAEEAERNRIAAYRIAALTARKSRKRPQAK